MNEHDAANLRFIMSRTSNQLTEWWNTISDDDKEYAVEILREARIEMELERRQFTEANAVLSRFMLN